MLDIQTHCNETQNRIRILVSSGPLEERVVAGTAAGEEGLEKVGERREVAT